MVTIPCFIVFQLTIRMDLLLSPRRTHTVSTLMDKAKDQDKPDIRIREHRLIIRTTNSQIPYKILLTPMRPQLIRIRMKTSRFDSTTRRIQIPRGRPTQSASVQNRIIRMKAEIEEKSKKRTELRITIITSCHIRHLHTIHDSIL